MSVNSNSSAAHERRQIDYDSRPARCEILMVSKLQKKREM